MKELMKAIGLLSVVMVISMLSHIEIGGSQTVESEKPKIDTTYSLLPPIVELEKTRTIKKGVEILLDENDRLQMENNQLRSEIDSLRNELDKLKPRTKKYNSNNRKSFFNRKNQ